jgi:hypothetical protein
MQTKRLSGAARPTAAVALLVAGLAGAFGLLARPARLGAQKPAEQPTAAAMSAELQTLRAEIEKLRGQVPGQAHVMIDVGQHFSGLWFAVKQKNWDLARFMFDETKSHLRWAVRVRPVRKLSTGKDLELQGILDGVENGVLDKLQDAVARKDLKAFQHSYRITIDACNSCHQAAEKPYLRVHVPPRLGEPLDLALAARAP